MYHHLGGPPAVLGAPASPELTAVAPLYGLLTLPVAAHLWRLLTLTYGIGCKGPWEGHSPGFVPHPLQP